METGKFEAKKETLQQPVEGSDFLFCTISTVFSDQ